MNLSRRYVAVAFPFGDASVGVGGVIGSGKRHPVCVAGSLFNAQRQNPPQAMNRYDAYSTHHRSRRLPGYDYRRAGWYFVTICTKNRLPLFGEVRGGIMGLNEAGCIAYACWATIPDHVPCARLDAFIVMPNHVHGLIGLLPQTDPVASGHAPALHGPDASPSGPDASLPRPGSLSVVIGSYKSAVT